MFTIRHNILAAAAILAAVLAASPFHASAADAPKESALIAVLTSNAPPAEKAITCKKLAVYGSKDAVPALAPLLLDKELTSWARIALEAIPDDAAGDALRDAMGKAQGRILIGIINSISVRHDAKAVDGLIAKLKDADADVVAAAAAALGQISGDTAAAALEQALASAPAAQKSSIAQGGVICASKFLAAGKNEPALKLYETVRKAPVSRQRILEATRGVILARQAAGIPLLAEQLKSGDKAFFALGLRVSRELKDPAVTDVLLAEMAGTGSDRMSLLLLALADRADPKALPAVIAAVKAGPTNVRVVAAGALERIGNVSCVPVLLDAAADAADAEGAKAAKATLARLVGKDIDADLFARLQTSTGRQRQILIELAEQRRIDGAMAVFLQSAEDADLDVRTAALVAIGAVGENAQVPDLLKLLQKARDPKDREQIEKALTSICARYSAACLPLVQPLLKSGDAADRIVALHAIGACGGTDALAAISSAVADTDGAVGDEAARTLSTWPNRWPDDTGVLDPLLNLAKSGKKDQHKILAIRGYLQYVQGTRKLNGAAKLAKMNEVLPLITRPDEKRLAIPIYRDVASAGAMDALATFVADPAIAEEACSAIIDLSGNRGRGIAKADKVKALQTVVAKSSNAATKKKAEDMLNGLK
ncbi:MAG: HEAT repeat domain-containing protein [Tepidisphaerales bacterium]